MTQTASNPAEPSLLSDEIRDGLLQDLLAVALILRDVEQQAAPGETRRRLAAASAALDADVRTVRALIARLRATA